MIEQTKLSVLASLLKRGREVNVLSLSLTLLSLLLLMLNHYLLFSNWQLVLLSSIVVIGVIEQYYAIRVALDADLFDYLCLSLSGIPSTEQPEVVDQSLQTLDNQLVSLRLIKSEQTHRPLPTRFQGAMALLKVQLVCVVLQVALLVVFFI